MSKKKNENFPDGKLNRKSINKFNKKIRHKTMKSIKNIMYNIIICLHHFDYIIFLILFYFVLLNINLLKECLFIHFILN